jgi:hypothetical protein
MNRAMSAHWNSIRNDLSRYIQSDEAARAFARAQEAQQLLRVFNSPAMAVEFLDSGVASFETSDAVAASLIKLAQSGAERQVAYAVLWLGLWRPLTCIHRSRMKYFDSRSELASSIAAKFHYHVERMPLNRVNKVIPTLLKNTKRDVLRERKRVWDDDAHRVDIDVEAALVERYPELLRTDDDHVAIDTQRILCSLERHADRVLLVAVLQGSSLSEAALSVGLSQEAARKRVQRARTRLRYEADRGSSATPELAGQAAT